MEQQTVTIAKAGIHAALNAHCSVLAAANPVYGQYDKSRRPQENIGLPDSLLSRFDLLFIVLDQLDPAFDRRLAEHVVRSHQYRRPGTLMEPEAINHASSSLGLEDTADSSEAVDSVVWQRLGKHHVQSPQQQQRSADHRDDVLTKDFLRKYIHYAKNRVQPALSPEAMEQISAAYTSMRAHQSRKNLPITARTLETLIRLSSATAKCRLSDSVDSEDVATAVELMNFVLFHEVGNSSVAAAGAKSAEERVDGSLAQQVRSALQQLSARESIEVSDLLQELRTQQRVDATEDQIASVLRSLAQENKVMMEGDSILLI